MQTLLVVLLLLIGIYFLFPKLVGLGDALSKLDEADAIWIAVAIGFNLAAIVTYIALFKAVVGGDALPLTWKETYEINMAGVAATRLFSAGGAGGIALTYWALRKAGMVRHDVARRMVAFLALQYVFYPVALIVCGVLLRTGVLPGKGSVELTIIPAAIAGLILLIGVLAALIPPDLRERLAGHVRGPRSQAIAANVAKGLATVGEGLRFAVRLLIHPSRRLGGDRRRWLLGGQHRHPLGLVQGLRRARAAGGGRPGLLPRHGRQPLPAGAGRGRGGRRGDDRRLRPLRHPRGDRLPGDPGLPAGRLLAADPARGHRLLPAPHTGCQTGKRRGCRSTVDGI